MSVELMWMQLRMISHKFSPYPHNLADLRLLFTLFKFWSKLRTNPRWENFHECQNCPRNGVSGVKKPFLPKLFLTAFENEAHCSDGHFTDKHERNSCSISSQEFEQIFMEIQLSDNIKTIVLFWLYINKIELIYLYIFIKGWRHSWVQFHLRKNHWVWAILTEPTNQARCDKWIHWRVQAAELHSWFPRRLP